MPGWNLSDSLVVDNKLGLTTEAPAAKDTVDLGRLGQIGLQDGKVHFTTAILKLGSIQR